VGKARRREEAGPVRSCSAPAPRPAGLTDVVFRQADAEPDAVVLRRRSGGAGWQDVTASRFRDEVAALAARLAAAGIGPGDRVAVMSRSRYEWTLADYAIWTAGGVSVPVYETSSADQAEWILSDSGARAVIAETSAHLAILASVSARLPGLEHVWQVDDIAAMASAGASATEDALAGRRRAGQDLASIVYTSGTTGRPKGCQLTHENLLTDVHSAIDALPEIFSQPGTSILLFLPLAHVFARIIEIGALESGAVLGHWPDPATLADGLAEFRPTFLLGVPRVFEKVYQAARQQALPSAARTKIFGAATEAAVRWSMAQEAGRRPGLLLRAQHELFDRLVYRKLLAAAGSQLRYAVSGGAPLSDRLAHYFRGVGITLLEGYGMTEAAGAASVNRPAASRTGTVGLPLPGVTIQIAADGEILIKGPNIFPGYWRNESATAAALDAAGWLHTGDIGSLDDGGFLLITGRKKDLIVTAGGTNVAPAVLEERIRAHQLVSQCVVVGDGRPFVACLVTLDADEVGPWLAERGRTMPGTGREISTDPEIGAEIQRAVDEANRAVSRAESIRRFAILDTDFTEAAGQLTPSGKVRRATIANDFAAEIEALYS
jgi:long-chain acyl-CoA synthetase